MFKIGCGKRKFSRFLSTIRRTVILPFFGWMPEVIYWKPVRVLFLPEDFIRYAEEATKSDLSARLEVARKRWESGERSLELVQEYVVGLLQRIHPDQVKGCLLSYFSTLTEEQLQQKENYLLMRGFMRTPEDDIVFRCLNRYADIYQGGMKREMIFG